eukprot:251615_1
MYNSKSNRNILSSDIQNHNIMRKQRTVNNGYINLDDVNVLPGYNYSEWIKISKFKLISRENALINIRIERIESITNKEMESFYISEGINNINKRTKYAIPQHVFKLCFDNISNTINVWQGIDLNKRNSSLSYQTFREYFKAAKNWWDQKKTKILGSAFWAPILNDIQKFVSPKILNNKHQLYQLYQILFHANIKYANTKEQPLVPNGIIKNCKAIKIFLFNLNNLLNIDLWLRQEIINEKEVDRKNNKIRKRTGNAKIISKQLRLHLINLAKPINIKSPIIPQSINTFTNQSAADTSDNINTQKHTIQSTKNVNNANSALNNMPYIDYTKLIFHLADEFIINNNINNSNIQHAINQQLQPNVTLIPLNMTQQLQSMTQPQIPQIVSAYNGYHIAPIQLQTSSQRYNPY